MLAVSALVIAVGYMAVLNHRKDGVWTFHVFDAAWWSPGVEGTRPVIDGAKQATSKANDALWGSGGLVDQAEQWFNGKVERAPAAADKSADKSAKKPEPAPTSPAQPAKPDPDVLLARRCEQAIADAEIEFQTGLDHYRRANPQGNSLTAAQRKSLHEARARFLSAQDRLDRTLESYATCSEHDPDRLKDGKALRDYNQRLISSLNRVIDEVETPR